MTDHDVVIVGGGSAGLAAARQLLDAGISPCIIDEQPRPGGQIARQPPREFTVGEWLNGGLYTNIRGLIEEVGSDPRLIWRGGTSVAGIMPGDRGAGFRLTLAGKGLEEVRARRVLIAGGCYDMPVAFPGWTVPGVMSVGAVQTLLKSQQVLTGERIAIFGTHPLMIVLAAQIVRAGGQVASVNFAQGFRQMLALGLSHGIASLRAPGALMAAGSEMAFLRRKGVRIRFGTGVRRAEAGDKGALSHLVLQSDGNDIAEPCDIAASCYGFLPQSDLVRQVGADVRWSDPAGGWEAEHDGAMRASVPGLYVAGETTGVAGSEIAMAEGAIAGLSIALDAGAITSQFAQTGMRAAQRTLERQRGFAGLLRQIADPTDFMPDADPDTLLCRCEDISAATIDATITQVAAAGDGFGADAVKLRCRAGMGLCQGRSCEHSVMRRIAQATARPVEQIDGYRSRFPARPLSIGDMIED